MIGQEAYRIKFQGMQGAPVLTIPVIANGFFLSFCGKGEITAAQR